MENVSVSEMLQAEIDQRNQSLNLQSLFTSAKAINNISTMHCFQVPEGLVQAYLLTEDAITTHSTPPQSAVSSHTNAIEAIAITVGDWYAVYEGVRYPGEVTSIGDEHDYQVSVMEPAGLNWRWPNPKDKIYYPKEKLVVKLNEPNLANNRGHYKFSVKF